MLNGAAASAGDTAGSSAPVDLVPPSLPATAQAGQTLQVDPGSWDYATSFEYQWFACSATTCTAILGATAATFVPTSTQLGEQLTVQVTAVGPGGSNWDSTNFSDAVTAAPVTTTVSPPITGSAGNSPTAVPSTAAVAADIRDVLKPRGANASLATVLAHRGCTLSFTAPTVGRLSVTWTATIAHHKVTIAHTSVNVAGASRMKVVLTLTPQGSRDLKSRRGLRIKAAAAFSSPGRRTVHETSTFKLSQRKSGYQGLLVRGK